MQLTVELITGSIAPTAGTTFNAFKAYADGSSAPITFTSSAAVGAVSLSISSKSGLSPGQSLCLQQASGATKVGEVVTVSAISGSSAPYTLTTASGIANNYSTGDNLYFMANVPTFSTMPSSTAGTWAASSDYATYLPLPTGQWVIQARNTDSTTTVIVNATSDQFQKIQ